MDAISLLREQAKWSHEEFGMTTGDVNADIAHMAPQGAAGTVGSSMAHAIFAEDNIVQGLLQRKAPLAMTAFSGKTGISEPHMYNKPEWVRSVRIDPPQLRDYERAVAQATDQYLASLKESDLDREIDLTPMGMGKRSLGWVLTALVIGHMHDLTGEISAIKGSQGLKGYPF
jgi:hypothetical protein